MIKIQVGIQNKSQNYEINETFEHNIDYLTKEDINHFKNENVKLF